MRISYARLCPECGSKVYSDPPEVPGLRCEAGHEFADLNAMVSSYDGGLRPTAEDLAPLPERDSTGGLLRERKPKPEARITMATTVIDPAAKRWLQLDGGEVLVVLRLGEQHARSIEAEAERQRMTPEDYLQRHFDHGLDARWYY